MLFYYVSHWKKQPDGRLALAGVIVAGGGEYGHYYPLDPKAQSEANSIAHEFQVEGGFDAVEWINTVSASGNGITEEYSDVRQLRGPSIVHAMETAFEQVRQEFGLTIDQFDRAESWIEVEDLGDPFHPTPKPVYFDEGVPRLRTR